MTIATYSELVEEMEAWLNRADLSARIPTFIRLFEARMNRRLRAPDMEQTFSFTTVDGTTTYALSARVRELRELYANVEVETDELNYTVTGESIIFDDNPGDDLTIVYSAFITLAALNDGNPTNWLLDDHPDIYLFGSLAEAYAFQRDDEAAERYKNISDEMLAEIIREANAKRLPAGPLQMPLTVRE